MTNSIRNAAFKSTTFAFIRSYGKPLIIVMLFVLLLAGLRMGWHYFLNPSASPQAIAGVLDLRGNALNVQRTIPLNGEWLFYSNMLLQPQDIIDEAGQIQHVPGSWLHNDTALSDLKWPAYGYGSYRLTILVDHSSSTNKTNYSLFLPEIPSAMKLYVNGEEQASRGKVAASPDDYRAFSRPLQLDVQAQHGHIELLIQVANYRNNIHGGLVYSPRFGTEQAIERAARYNYNIQIVAAIVLAIHAVYACILYMLGLRHRVLLHFAALVIFSIMTILLTYDALAADWLQLSYEWALKWQYLSFLGAGASLLAFSKALFPGKGFTGVYPFYLLLCLTAICFTLLYPLHDKLQPLLLLFIVTPYLLVPVMLLHRTAQHREDLFLLLGGAAAASNAIWYYLDFNWLRGHIYYPLDLFAALLSLSAYWFRRYFRVNEETKQLALRLQQTEKQKDNFLANTSHELRTPLHGMLNLAQQVEQRYGRQLTAADHHNLTILISLGRRMSYMLNDLLDHSRLPGLQMQTQSVEVALRATVDEVMHILQFTLADKPVSLLNHVPKDFPLLQTDEQRLQQILLNLLHNAIKYTDRGEITVHAACDQGFAQISVSDSGCGIDSDRLALIFQPYEQGNRQDDSGEGFGLGLSICMKLVRLQGGTLRVASTPGQGSVFTFTVPLLSGVNETSTFDTETMIETAKFLPSNEQAAQVTAPPDTYRVLLVDNNPISRHMLSSVLSGTFVQFATTTAQGLHLLEQEKLDLMIIHSKLPGRSAMELVEAVRDRFSRSELPILLLHAEDSAAKIDALMSAGINDLIAPSADSTELKARIESWCAYRRSVLDRLRLEAAFLQAQVQPDFLLEALHTASVLSRKDTRDMRLLLEAFGKYLRYSFDMRNVDRFSDLMREKEAVEAYLDILRMQYGTNVPIDWLGLTTAPLGRLLIPPLSLLPLIQHALPVAHMSQQKLTVQLTLVDQQHLILSIEEQLGLYQQLEIEQNEPAPTDNGLLLLNHRLKQLYGSTLQMCPLPDGGSRVWFEIVLTHEVKKYDNM